MTTQEYITRKTAGTVTLGKTDLQLSQNTTVQDPQQVQDVSTDIALTIMSYDPITGEATESVDIVTIDAVQSEINQLQILLEQAKQFLADLQAV